VAQTQDKYRKSKTDLIALSLKAYNKEMACVREKAAAGLWNCGESAEAYVKRLETNRRAYD